MPQAFKYKVVNTGFSNPVTFINLQRNKPLKPF